MYSNDWRDKRRLYRSRNGLLLGVCRGVAEYFNLSVGWTRVLVFVIFLCTGFWPVGALYLLAALLLKKAPRAIDFDETSYRTPEGRRAHAAWMRMERRLHDLERRFG